MTLEYHAGEKVLFVEYIMNYFQFSVYYTTGINLIIF